MRNITLAARMLLKTPFVTAIAILSLALGIGANAAIFSMFDQMLRHQADDGRFLTPGGTTGKKATGWASLPCDPFAILEVLLLFGRKGAPSVDVTLARVRQTFADTAQGPAWHCIPDPVAMWRGPGRKNDACLQVTVEALRLFALVPATERPRTVVGAGRTLLRAWRSRTAEKTYMFGHGKRFIAGKWPPTWYGSSRPVSCSS